MSDAGAAKKRFVELPTPIIIELELKVGDNWHPLLHKDSWLVPEEEYLKLIGRPN